MQPHYRLEGLSRVLWAARSDDGIQGYQDRQVRRLVAHAYRHVPYYRSLMREHGLRPEDIHGAADLQRFPVTRKDDMQSLPPSDLLARGQDPRNLVHHRTSGSTGQPFNIYRTWLEERTYGAYRWRVLGHYGYRPSHRHAEVEELQPGANGDHRGLHRLNQRLGLLRQRRIHALQDPESIYRALCDWGPQALTGYAGVLARVASQVRDGKRRVRPDFVCCHSDMLTDGMRNQIGETFDAPVFELYDTYEVNVIAWQCPRSPLLHTADPCCVVEVVRDGVPAVAGERGEVVLTALHSWSMPFIRFVIGDLATRGPACACGRPEQTLAMVDGRTVEYFALPDGRVVHPYELYAALEATDWIRQYQLVQERVDTLHMRVVPAGDVTKEALDQHRQTIARLLGESVRFRIERVAQLEAGPNGKTRAFRSLVVNP